jgi:predicted DNA-binding transcriptional regulator AlpA
MEGKLTYSVPEVGKILGISRNLAYELARRGDLPGVIHLGEKRMVVSKSAIQRLIAADNKKES